MAKKSTKGDNLVSNVFGIGTELLNFSAGIISNTANAIDKLRGGTVEVEDIIEVLDELKITEAQYTSEKNIEKIIAEKLDDYWRVHRQYNMEGFLGLKIDIDINETVGIELKLAKELNATNIERLLGQTMYYQRRKYGDNLIVVVVGTPKGGKPKKN